MHGDLADPIWGCGKICRDRGIFWSETRGLYEMYKDENGSFPHDHIGLFWEILLAQV
jgi:hypothetical protein